MTDDSAWANYKLRGSPARTTVPTREVTSIVRLFAPSREGRIAIGRHAGRCCALYYDSAGRETWRYV